MIRFYNTLTRTKEEFKPISEGTVRMYSCGPTVYDFAHIGNFRAYVFADLLQRHLEFRGYRVVRVMNITDVDDKTIGGAAREGVTLQEYTQRYTRAFLEDIDLLRIRRPGILPCATHHIPEIVAIVQALLDKGLAYRKDDSIYFRISSFPGYGRLSRLDAVGIQAGARVETDEYSKEDVRDFALWKAAKEGEVSWDTPLGKGRPGWHIECSAMSMKYLGNSFDIHTGGVDLVFPHHENEIAQSEGFTGEPFVRYWLHNAHLLVDNEKMSKSKGNFYTLRDLLQKGADPLAIRYLLLTTHYRDPLNFTKAALNQAANTVGHYNDFYRRLRFHRGGNPDPRMAERIERARRDFLFHLDDDLNISPAMAAVFDLIRDVNVAISERAVDENNTREIAGFLEDIDRILCILRTEDDPLEEEFARLIEEREQARRRRDFRKSDEIRDLLKARGILLEDTPQGTRWKREQDGR